MPIELPPLLPLHRKPLWIPNRSFPCKGRTALELGSCGIGTIASGFIGWCQGLYLSRKAEVCEAVAEELGPNCIAVPQDISARRLVRHWRPRW